MSSTAGTTARLGPEKQRRAVCRKDSESAIRRSREAQRTTRQNDGFRRDPVRTERIMLVENTSGGFAKGGSAARLVCSACDRTTLLVVR